MVDLVVHKKYILTVDQNGLLSVYHNQILIKSFTKLNLPVLYQTSPTSQTFSFSKVLSYLDSGLVLFPVSRTHKYGVAYLNLEDTNPETVAKDGDCLSSLKVILIPGFSSESVNGMALYKHSSFLPINLPDTSKDLM